MLEAREDGANFTSEPSGSVEYGQSSAAFDLLPELLLEIFHHCIPDTFTELNDLSWINFSYVCGRWRDVSLSSPNLWNAIILRHPQWTRELIIRSKELPLRFHIDIPAVTWSQTQSVLSDNCHRTESLVISANFENIRTILWALPSFSSTESLRTIQICNCDFPEKEDVMLVDVPETIASKLQGLHCEGIVFLSRVPLQLNLTSVTISFPPLCKRRPEMGYIITLLGETPSLQHLVIRGTVFPLDPDNHRFHLPHLKSLHFEDGLVNTARFLMCILLPRECLLTLKTGLHSLFESVEFRSMYSVDDEAYWNAIILDRIALYYPILSTSPCRVRIDALQDSTRCRIWSSDGDLSTYKMLCDITYLTGSLPFSIRVTLNLLSYKVAHATHITFSDPSRLLSQPSSISHDNQSTSKLDTLLHLTHLTIRDAEPPSLFEYLTLRSLGAMKQRALLPPSLNHYVSPDIENVPLPSLTNLSLEDLDLSYFLPPTNDKHADVTLLDLVLVILWVRRQLGCTMRRIRILRCTCVQSRTLRSLRKYADVHWDGLGLDLEAAPVVDLETNSEAFIRSILKPLRRRYSQMTSAPVQPPTIQPSGKA